MSTLDRRQQLIIGLVLAAAMAMTRFNHFGSPLNLPDAALAVFFLGGFYLARWAWFAVFVAEAGLMDWASIAEGVSDWCVTAAYGFLVPTYACLWIAGRWYAGRARRTWAAVVPLIGALGPALLAAFVISNGSFYLFSGYFDALGWSEYMRAVTGYFPGYAGYTLMYLAIAACAHGLIAFLPGRFRPVSGA